jgi:hypothetical protein
VTLVGTCRRLACGCAVVVRECVSLYCVVSAGGVSWETEAEFERLPCGVESRTRADATTSREVDGSIANEGAQYVCVEG